MEKEGSYATAVQCAVGSINVLSNEVSELSAKLGRRRHELAGTCVAVIKRQGKGVLKETCHITLATAYPSGNTYGVWCVHSSLVFSIRKST